MQRFDFFFRQKVTEGELDAAFDAVETFEFNSFLDAGLVGIQAQAVVTENAGTPNLTVDISGPGVTRDQLGQRINWTATQDVDVSVDENSNSTAVVTPGNEKFLSIFAKFTRSLSDPRLDGTGATVFHNRAESFEINVVQGAEAVIATATRPPLRADEILLADLRLIFGQTQVLNADINTAPIRREDAFVITTGATTVRAGTAEAAMQALSNALPSLAALADNTAADDGATLIGIDAIAGAPSSIAQGTVKTALSEVVAALNGKVAQASADTITALKSFGVGGAIEALASHTGGLVRSLAGRARQHPMVADLRDVNLGAVFAALEGGLVSLVVDNGQFMVLVNASLDAAAGTYIATATGDAFQIEIGAAPIFTLATPDPGSGIIVRYRLGVTLNDTWTDTGWGTEMRFTTARQTARQGTIAGGAAAGAQRHWATRNTVPTGLVVGGFDQNGGGGTFVNAGFGLDSTGGTGLALPGSGFVQAEWDIDTALAADRLTLWMPAETNTGGAYHIQDEGHSAVNRSEMTPRDFTGAVISVTAGTLLFDLSAVTWVLDG